MGVGAKVGRSLLGGVEPEAGCDRPLGTRMFDRTPEGRGHVAAEGPGLGA